MFQQLLSHIRHKADTAPAAPFIIAISGFGGSGKSTLSAQIKAALNDAETVSIDDFIINHLSRRSDDWNDFDRVRFLAEVLSPARQKQPITYGIYDWQQDAIIKQRHVPPVKFLIVEGCSILHPSLVEYYDFSIWVDVSLIEATQRGIARTRALGSDETSLANWHNIWAPNERDFFDKYRPDQLADFVYTPIGHNSPDELL